SWTRASMTNGLRLPDRIANKIDRPCRTGSKCPPPRGVAPERSYLEHRRALDRPIDVRKQLAAAGVLGLHWALEPIGVDRQDEQLPLIRVEPIRRPLDLLSIRTVDETLRGQRAGAIRSVTSLIPDAR